MKVTVLGISNGLDCIDSPNTSLLVESAETSILVDVSASPRQELLKAGVDPLSLDAVFITHGHIDHVYAFPSLIHSMWLSHRRKPLLVVGNEYSIEVCRHLFSYFHLNRKIGFEMIWNVLPIEKVGGVGIDSFSLYHRPNVPVNGYCFTADDFKVSYFPDNVASFPIPTCTKSSDILIHEAGGLDKDANIVNESHTTALQAAMVAREANAGKLILVHLPEGKDLRCAMLDEARSVFPNTEIPFPGFVIQNQ